MVTFLVGSDWLSPNTMTMTVSFYPDPMSIVKPSKEDKQKTTGRDTCGL